jgi:hypothetical protein
MAHCCVDRRGVASIATRKLGKRGGTVAPGEALGNVPFEFVGEVASAGAVAEARNVERGTTAARHGCRR